MIKRMNKRNERNTGMARRYEQKFNDDWYVIMDGSDDPYICHESEIAECMDELREVIVDSVCEDLQDSISDRYSLNSMVDAVLREYDDGSRLSDPDYWITIYCVDADVIRKYNEYARHADLPFIDEDAPTEEQIRKALCSKRSLDLSHFLEQEKCDYKSYYTPELALEGGVNDSLVEELLEILEEED